MEKLFWYCTKYEISKKIGYKWRMYLMMFNIYNSLTNFNHFLYHFDHIYPFYSYIHAFIVKITSGSSCIINNPLKVSIKILILLSLYLSGWFEIIIWVIRIILNHLRALSDIPTLSYQEIQKNFVNSQRDIHYTTTLLSHIWHKS